MALMPSLWTPPNWPQRLAELQAPTGELKEAPLRRDVRSLGMLLGEVLREQAGLPVFEAVEELRQTAIARREAEEADTAGPSAPPTPRAAASHQPSSCRRRRRPAPARIALRGGAQRALRPPARPRLRPLLRAHQPGRDQPPQTP